MLEATNLLVTCPSCRALYRHAAAAAGADRARCSRCSSVFLLTGSVGASYRVVDAAALPVPRPGIPHHGPGAPLGIGMDDPSLAEQLERAGRTSGPGAERRPMTYRVLADEEPEHASARTAAPGVADEVVAAESPAEATPAPVRARHGALARGTITLCCIGLGAAAGYLTASDLAGDFRVGAAIGGAAGLVLAWGWLRWMSRNT